MDQDYLPHEFYGSIYKWCPICGHHACQGELLEVVVAQKINRTFRLVDLQRWQMIKCSVRSGPSAGG
jgi:hypothetical protein